ncbi:pentapeptide repeat-containing protein [Actinoplanes sp. NPDC049681]|uniref:pentapeptide repeat-containing protein n=1 Tax=Actinoplanes sp. NPDC049681 TaxID=3363905 RepID=UPI0037B14864
MKTPRSPVERRLARVLRHPGFWARLAVLAAAGLLVLLLGPVAWWATPAKHLHGKDKADARNATRQVLLAAVGGLVLLTGAGFTARTFFLTRRGQYTDRYTKAIAQLASDKLTERLGGIYALEHLMIESERDHPTVVEVLAAFIRERTLEVPEEPETDDPSSWPPTATDVQAALTVLGRRPHRAEPSSIELSGTRLRRANLTGLRFSGAQFQNADLRGAYMEAVDLQGAQLFRASMQKALLSGAHLQDARLFDARLAGAHLRGARLHRASLGADLTGAHLSGAELDDALLGGAVLKGAYLGSARLHGVDLRETKGLTREQVDAAETDDRTQLPADLPYARPRMSVVPFPTLRSLEKLGPKIPEGTTGGVETPTDPAPEREVPEPPDATEHTP